MKLVRKHLLLKMPAAPHKIKNLDHIFRSGRTNVTDSKSSGSPNEVATPKANEKIDDLVWTIRYWKRARSWSHCHNIWLYFKSFLGGKLSANWVQFLLIIDNKHNKVFVPFHNNEILIDHNKPKINKQSK